MTTGRLAEATLCRYSCMVENAEDSPPMSFLGTAPKLLIRSLFFISDLTGVTKKIITSKMQANEVMRGIVKITKQSDRRRLDQLDRLRLHNEKTSPQPSQSLLLLEYPLQAMPAPISFGARTGRDNNYVGVVKTDLAGSIGPGAYSNLPNSIQNSKPSYAPFGSTAKRKFTTPANSNLTPSPMTYDPKPVDNTAPPVSAPFKGNAPRIPEPKKGENVPGPGAYYIPSTIKPAAPSLQRSYFDETPLWQRTATAPSIPGAGQCFGYEEGVNGELIMQRPVQQGYKGDKDDRVGPMDYKPKLTQTHKSTNVIDFGKGTSRPDISTKVANLKKGDTLPGPGSYNLEGKTNTSAAKPPTNRKRNAVFESKVQRLKEKRRYVSTTFRTAQDPVRWYYLCLA